MEGAAGLLKTKGGGMMGVLLMNWGTGECE